MEKENLKKILAMLESEEFAKWYKTDFQQYFCGDLHAKDEDAMLDDIDNML